MLACFSLIFAADDVRWWQGSTQDYNINNLPSCPSTPTEGFSVLQTTTGTGLNYLTYDLCRRGASGTGCTGEGLPTQDNFLNQFQTRFLQNGLNNDGCWESGRFELRDNQDMGLVLGGYLFVTSSSSSFRVNLRAGAEVDDIHGFAHAIIFPVDAQGNTLDDQAPYRYVPNYAYIQGTNNWPGEDTEWTSISSRQANLDVGVYYVYIVVVHEGNNRDRSNDMEFVQFNVGNQAATNMVTDNSFSNSQWDVMTDLPAPNVIASTYRSRVEFDNSPTYCELSGFTYGPLGATSGQFCCGDDTNDAGSVHQGTGDTCVQDQNGDWSWSTAIQQCELANGDLNSDYIIAYGTPDGSDGCCGDDTADYGYVTGDRKLFCNNDNLNGNLVDPSITQGTNTFWSTDNRYRIHTVNGIDYTNNGRDWYSCSPTDTNTNNFDIGQTEFMSEPPLQNTQLTTCVDSMKYLFDQGAFDSYNPPANIIFTQATQSGSGQAWTCDPQANNDMNNFFGSVATSCVESCYLTAGSKVRSINSSIDDLKSYLCGYGLDVTACTGVETTTTNQEEVSADTYDTQYLNHPQVDSCDDIRKPLATDGYAGYLCETPNSYCNTQEYFSISGMDSTNQVCCKALEGTNYDQVCINQNIQNGGSTSVIEEVTNPSLHFSCQEWSGEQRFVECCGDSLNNGDSSCYNALEPTQYYQEGSKSGMYVTRGGSNFMIDDFDYYEANELVRTANQQTNIRIDKPYIYEIQAPSQPKRAVSDWSKFTQLEFEISYNEEDAAQPYDFVLIYDTTTGQTNQEQRLPLSSLLINGQGPINYHHAIVSLPNNIETAKRIEIQTQTQVYGLSVTLDNIYLSGHKDGFTNKFCSGDFGIWVEDLDGPYGAQGFPTDAQPAEYLPYQVACSSIPSYGWTGSMCCGDDTTPSNKETYVDTNGACFEGTALMYEAVVGSISQKQNQEDLLYANNQYYYCQDGQSTNPYQNLQNTHGENIGQSIISESMVGDVVSGFACTDTGTWMEIGQISNTKLLASYIYNITKDEPSYSIHCQNLKNVSPAGQQELLSYFNEDAIDVFCGAQITTQQDEKKSLLGFMLAEVPFEEQEQQVPALMQALASYFSAIHLLDASSQTQQNFLAACDSVNPSSQELFYTCQPQGTNNVIRILINPQEKIYIVSYVENTQDFGGVFQANTLGDYFNNIIYFFTNLFTGWFTESDTQEVDNRLPTILSTTNFNLDAVVITSQEMENGNKKTVTAFVEHQENDKLYVMEYANFYTPIEALAQRYYGDETELNYQKGTNRQVIQLYENLANQRKYSFEPAFDWRLITTALRLDDQNNGSYVTSRLNDGVLDIGEECDTGPDGDLFKNMQTNTCKEYFSNIPNVNTDATITCINGVIDVSACNFCGDGVINAGETCDDDNTVNGDGCDSSCQVEFCGDGIINNVNEVCDDGNQVDEGYQGVSCSQANYCNAGCSAYVGCIGDSVCQTPELTDCRNNPFLHSDCQYCDGDNDGFNVINDCDDTDDTIGRCGTGSGGGGTPSSVCTGTYEAGICIDETNSGCNTLIVTSYHRDICESNAGCSWFTYGTATCDPNWGITECELRGCTYNS